MIYGRTPELFRSICRQARNFCREYGIKGIVLSPLNEWQEGSYLEPNRIRDSPCTTPSVTSSAKTRAGLARKRHPEGSNKTPDYPPMVIPPGRWNFDLAARGRMVPPTGGGRAPRPAMDACILSRLGSTALQCALESPSSPQNTAHSSSA